MSDSGDDQSAQKRAHWVSLRTLQRVPNVVGETDSGEPIVEVGAARLVLPHGANNFYLLSACPGCGKERVTDAVLTTAHLAHRRVEFCSECAAGVRFDPDRPDEVASDADPPLFDLPSGVQPSVGPEADSGVELGSAAAEARAPRAATDADEVKSEALVTDVTNAVAGRLERDRTQLIAQLADAVSGALERHRQALAIEVTDALAGRFEQALAQLDASVTERLDAARTEAAAQLSSALAAALEAKLRSLDELVSGRLDEGRLEVMAQLESSLGAAPENPREALASAVGMTAAQHLQDDLHALSAAMVEQLEANRTEILAQVERTLADKLDEQRKEVEAATASAGSAATSLAALVQDELRGVTAAVTDGLQLQRAEVMSALDRTLAGRFEEHGRAVADGVSATLDQRFGRDLPAVASAIQKRMDGAINALGTGLGKRFDDDVRYLGTTLEQRIDEEVRGLQAALTKYLVESQADVLNRLQDLVAVVREDAGAPMSEETAASFFAARADLYRRLDRVGEEAAKAGMNAARVLLRATEQHVLATSGALAARVAELQTEVADARQSLSEVRRAVERMARRLPAAGGAPAKPTSPRKKSSGD